MNPDYSKRQVPSLLRLIARTAFLAGALTLVGASAQAQTYYVDVQNPAADNAGPGTELVPYRSLISAVLSRKGAGVTILVKPGVYREMVSIPASGSAAAPYVIRATGPGVIIDGSDDLSGADFWVRATGTVFLYPDIAWAAKQVLVDGKRLVASTAAPAVLPVGSFAYVVGEGLYANLGGDNPGAHLVQVSRRNYGFTMSSRSFVTIDGFEITRTNDRGINMNSCADLRIANNKVTFANSYAIQAVACQRVLIEGNVAADANFHGIGLTSNATAGSSGCIVRNNESTRNAHPTVRQANGIYLYGSPGNTIYGNRLHHNQDTGMHFATGSNDCLSYNNRSWANGDHGYDHLASINTTHVNDVSFGNYRDGFSFEGNASGGRLFNSISVDNGLTTNSFDLWVDAASSVGFVSDYNLLWNSTTQPPVKFGTAQYGSIVNFRLLAGLDAHSVQADPKFVNAANGDFRLAAGSPAIDAATSNAPSWPALDALGAARVDDTRTANTGAGPVTFADLGALELTIVVDRRPDVVSPASITVVRGTTVTFTVTASDPDGDAITSLVMLAPNNRPSSAGVPTFVTNADRTSGTFTWRTGTTSGTYNFRFIARNALADTSTTSIRTVRTLGASESEGFEGSFPGVVALSNAFPMPSAGAVEFTLSLPTDEAVDWGIFDAQGRQVWSESRMAGAGQLRLRWDGSDSNGRRTANGLYFARVRVGAADFVRRVIRL